MKIIHINTVYGSGSTGRIMRALHLRLIRDGIESFAFYGRGKKINDENALRLAKKEGVILDVLFTRISGWVGFASDKATKLLSTEIMRIRPDIVHLHNLHGYYLNIAKLLEALKQINSRVICTLHDEFIYTGRCAYSMFCDGWKYGCGNCKRLQEFPSTFFFDKSSEMLKIKKNLLRDFNNITIVSPSAGFANRLKDSFLSDKKHMVIHNGIDTKNVFKSVICNHNPGKKDFKKTKTVLAIAPKVAEKIKGKKYILELAKSFSENKNVQFILIGAKNAFSERIKNVEVIQHINNPADLSELYSKVDVFLLCSKMETFSMTCAEAICCGTPVAGFECIGPETVFKEPYAKFVEQGNVSKLRQILINTLENPPNRNEIAEYGKKEFSEETMYQKYLELYKDGI